jgi:4-phospho-D-threonate 3-dehydrogenase / 4-phospho-D-erythronate 3-dehydrogenase
MSKRPVVAATLGDPAGIGPEVLVKSLASRELDDLCDPILFGDTATVERACKVCGVDARVRSYTSLADVKHEPGTISVIDNGALKPNSYVVGQPSEASGHAVLAWLDHATRLCQGGEVDALVWGPVNGTSLEMTGKIKHIDDLQPPDTYMFRVSGNLRVVPITEHIPIRDVASTVTKENVGALISLLNGKLQNWGIKAPRIAVAGLNCHAMFEEDREHVAPAVADARARGIDATGPISPDSVFRMAMGGKFDAIVTMYHDQGQVAVKTSAFEGACTICMGPRLPYVLVAIPHGSAYDIAGTGKAQHKNMLAALKTAAHLGGGRGFTD